MYPGQPAFFVQVRIQKETIMDQSRLVGFILGDVRISEMDLSSKSKAQILFKACVVFSASSENMVSSMFTSWEAEGFWRRGYVGNSISFPPEAVPNLVGVDSKTRVCYLCKASADEHELVATQLCITDKGLVFFFSYESVWRDHERDHRLAKKWKFEEATFDALKDFFEKNPATFEEALVKFVEIGNTAVGNREKRLQKVTEARDQLARIASAVTGRKLQQNLVGNWDFV